MPGKRFAMWLILLGALSLTGCCSWCERNCPACHAQTAPACYPPAQPQPQPTCYAPPNTVSYPAPPPAQQTLTGCSCTCPNYNH